MNERREPPPNLRSLRDRIQNVSSETGRPVGRIQRALANTVVGQMLPPGVIKGGTALAVRAGENARFSPDFDASRSPAIELEEYVTQLADRLDSGWGGFKGTLAAIEPRQPEGVPAAYVMQPFEIRLAYAGSHWLTVEFELGRDEVGSTEEPEMRLAADIVELFLHLGLEEPQPLPVMRVEHQVAQKIHACTFVNPKTGRNERAHDLVDLQILDEEEGINAEKLAVVAERLFAARRAQEWPPTIVAYDGWPELYAAAAEDLAVLDSVEEAIEWANDLVGRAHGSRSELEDSG